MRLVCERDDPAPSPAEQLADVLRRVRRGRRVHAPTRPGTIFAAAKTHGLRPKLHADQLADGGGAALAAEVGAISGRPPRIRQRRRAAGDGRTPASSRCCCRSRRSTCGSRRSTPAAASRPASPVAVATDFNPGSAPSYHLPLAMTLACTMNRLTPARGAARGDDHRGEGDRVWSEEVGSLEAGKRADFVLLDAEIGRALAVSLPAERGAAPSIAGGRTSGRHERLRPVDSSDPGDRDRRPAHRPSARHRTTPAAGSRRDRRLSDGRGRAPQRRPAGAAEGPAAIRQALFKLTPDAEQYDAFVDLLRQHGRSRRRRRQPATSKRIRSARPRCSPRTWSAGRSPIVLGGGHETAYGHFLGYVRAGQRIAILNWDAHPDVRPLKDGQGHSGSPFRQALEHASGSCDGYTVAGLNPPSVARAHLDYLAERDCRFTSTRRSASRRSSRSMPPRERRDVGQLRSRRRRSGGRPGRQRAGDGGPVAARLATCRLSGRAVLDRPVDRRGRTVPAARSRRPHGTTGGADRLGVSPRRGRAPAAVTRDFQLTCRTPVSQHLHPPRFLSVAFRCQDRVCHTISM